MPKKVILGTPEVKKSKFTNKKTLFEEKKGARFFSTFIQSGTSSSEIFIISSDFRFHRATDFCFRSAG